MAGRRAIQWSRRIADSRWGDFGLFFASFSETTVVPVPMEVILIPHMAANRHRIWWLATVTLLGCLAGAVLGYAVGLLLFDTLGQWALDAFGWREDFEVFRQWFERIGFLAIVALGIVPIPFQTAMLLAGLTHYSFFLFVAAAVLARGIRYYGLAALVLAVGPYAETLWRRHSTPVGVGVTVLAIALFVGLFWWGGMALSPKSDGSAAG
jgi:membrane protein YqaA with SNARE-associated domain